MDIIEVDGDDKAGFTVYRNAVPGLTYPTFDCAMIAAFPGWHRDSSFGETCETRGDNF